MNINLVNSLKIVSSFVIKLPTSALSFCLQEMLLHHLCCRFVFQRCSSTICAVVLLSRDAPPPSALSFCFQEMLLHLLRCRFVFKSCSSTICAVVLFSRAAPLPSALSFCFQEMLLHHLCCRFLTSFVRLFSNSPVHS